MPENISYFVGWQGIGKQKEISGHGYSALDLWDLFVLSE